MIDIFLSELTRLGITTDIAGALLLARGVFWRSNETIFNTVKSYFGYNRMAAESEIAAKRETLVGVAILILGFALQFFGTTTPQSTTIHLCLLIWWCVLWALAILGTIFAIKTWTNKTIDKLVEEDQKKKQR